MIHRDFPLGCQAEPALFSQGQRE